jgi:hypothetical protein
MENPMSIAIQEEHLELARVARSFLADHGARAANRAQLEAKQESLPPFWKPLIELGWTGLHLPEAFGGAGFGLLELAVVVEELGFAVAPGPSCPPSGPRRSRCLQRRCAQRSAARARVGRRDRGRRTRGIARPRRRQRGER